MMIKKSIHLFILILTFDYIGPAQAQTSLDLSKPFTPFQIVGNLYYVGNDYAASYLIVTSQGDVLINSNSKTDVPMIKASVEKLGFKFSDIKILLISHAHSDHAGGSAFIKKETGASYMVMDADVPVVESGGKTDFQYGNDPTQLYPPTKVDRVLHDGDQVKLGDTVLVAHLTPGHTKGCTTWTMEILEENTTYHVVIVGGAYLTSNYKLVGNAAYPTIAQDYEQMFNVLTSLPCDIFLGAHGMYFDLDKKYALMNKGAANPFIDPEGYEKFIRLREQDFYNELANQLVTSR